MFVIARGRSRILVYSGLLLMLLFLWAGAGRSRADDAPEESAEAESAESTSEPTEKKPPETILEMIVAGGTLNIAFMVGLGIFSLAGATVTLERIANLTRNKVLPPDFLRELQDLVQRQESNPERFREICQRSPSPIANILKGGLLRAGRPITEVEKSMEDVAAREASILRSKVRPLSVVASVAPLIGLLGTVVGMIMAFRMASQAGLGKAELLAEGIYLALETTVAGLVIAIPCLLFAAMFNARGERYMRDIAEALMDALPSFDRMEQPAAGKPGVSGNPLLAGKK